VIESNEKRQNERRFQAGRPYIRPRNKHQVSAESDYLYTIIITFIVGSMLGAVVTLGAITTGVYQL
jgi:hypothetical protein